jgi:hypothetical protein
MATKAGTKKQYTLIKPKEAAIATGMSASTLKKYRLQIKPENEGLIKDIHWVAPNSRQVLYRLELVQDWASTRHDPAAHLAAIEEFERHQKAGTSIDRLAPA